MLCFGGGRKKPLSEFLEHLASDNGADMYKYNMLYTIKFKAHVLTREAYKVNYLNYEFNSN